VSSLGVRTGSLTLAVSAVILIVQSQHPLGSGGAFAQVTTTSRPPASVTTTSTTLVPTSQVSSPPTSISQTADGSKVAGWILLFGLLILLLMFAYLNLWRRDIGRWILTAFRRTDQFPRYDHIPVTARPTEEARLAGAEESQIVVHGPALVTVGVESAPFTVRKDAVVVQADWAVEPADAAGVDPGRRQAVRVTATKEGPFQVKAQVPGVIDAAVAHVTANAAAPPGEIPFVGAGYGGLMVAIAAVTIAGSLTALGVLPGAALATLLGTVVSYFFVRSTTQG
jgi:hypothetical protein